MGVSFSGSGGRTAAIQLLPVGIWVVVLIISSPYSTGPSSALPFHGWKKEKKVLCCLHSLGLLESCMRNISHTRVKKGQNLGLKPKGSFPAGGKDGGSARASWGARFATEELGCG